MDVNKIIRDTFLCGYTLGSIQFIKGYSKYHTSIFKGTNSNLVYDFIVKFHITYDSNLYDCLIRNNV